MNALTAMIIVGSQLQYPPAANERYCARVLGSTTYRITLVETDYEGKYSVGIVEQ